MHKIRLFLKNLSKGGLDVPLLHGEPVVIGRGPQTKIKDPRLSRHQVKVTANFASRNAKVVQVGRNASTTSDGPIGAGKSAIVRIGDRLELLEGEHAYVLAMEDNLKAEKGTPAEREAKPAAASSKPKPAPILPHTGHWSHGLLAAMSNPAMQLYVDDRVVIIADKYPKARHHFLVLPKEKIADLESVGKGHLDLLEYMHEKADDRAKNEYPGVEFRFGYHAVPSMSQLHLHAISQDFDSPCLKNKKHWNSFNTDYFVPSEKVISDLRQYGEVQLISSSEGREELKKNLKCHKCEYVPKNLPDLKAHIKMEHFP